MSKTKFYSDEQYERFVQNIDSLKQQFQEGHVIEVGIFYRRDDIREPTFNVISGDQTLVLLFILDDLVENTEWKS